jgi:hypothetical protein
MNASMALRVAGLVSIVITGCARQEEATRAAPLGTTLNGEPAASMAKVDDLPSPIDVDVERQLDGMPVRIGPLPAGTTLGVDDVRLAKILRSDPVFLHFFPDQTARATARIEVGMITDLGANDGANSAVSYPGYVVSGGEATCVFSGPPDAPHDGPVPCSIVIVVNALDGSVPRSQEREVVP